jgi:hypothetical protein
MNIHYKIVEKWPETHSIVARYWTDVVSEEYLASDPNRKDDGTPVRCRSDVSLYVPNPQPEGFDIDALIIKNVPYAFLESIENFISPEVDTDMKSIDLHVHKTLSADEFFARQTQDLKNLEPVNPSILDKPLTEEEIHALLNQISVNQTK